MREASHQERIPNYAHHAQTMQAVRAALGEAAFAAAWEAGRALPAEEAVDLPRTLGLLRGLNLAGGAGLRFLFSQILFGTVVRGRQRRLRDPLHDRPHRFMGDAEVARHRPQPVALDPHGDLRPSLPWDARSFRRWGIPANPRSSSCVEQSLRIEERDERQGDHVYLAEAIPVASGTG